MCILFYVYLFTGKVTDRFVFLKVLVSTLEGVTTFTQVSNFVEF